MRVKFRNWPFEEDEVVTLHWVLSPRINRDGEKICEVYFRTGAGVIKSVTIGWGCFPMLRINQKYANGKHMKEEVIAREITFSTSDIKKIKYRDAVDIIPKDLYPLKNPRIFREKCCVFKYQGYTYYVPCIELARVILARNSVLANQLISTGGLEELIDIASWQYDGETATFNFREDSSGISPKFAKTFAALYGMPQLYEDWQYTYFQYVHSKLIQTFLPSQITLKAFFTEVDGTKQRFIYEAEFAEIEDLIKKTVYGPAKLVHSGKRNKKKGVVNRNLPSENSELDTSGTLARRTQFTTTGDSTGGNFLDRMEVERITMKDYSETGIKVIEQEAAEETFSVGDISNAGKTAAINLEMTDIQIDSDPDFTSFCGAIDVLSQYPGISIKGISFEDLPQGKRVSVLNIPPKRRRKYACVLLQKGADIWVIIELCNKDGYSISTLFARCMENKEELVKRILDKLMISNGSWVQKHFPKQVFRTLDHHESRSAARWALLMYNKMF